LDEPPAASILEVDEAFYLTDLTYAVSEWGLTADEWKKICVSLGKVGVHQQTRKAYVADLLSIIEAGFDAYFDGLENHSQGDQDLLADQGNPWKGSNMGA
jgi:hypothetical protein